jgi:hypothetical protein
MGSIVMFKKQTLFIVGAGSSAEVDLPLGRALAATIGKKMDIRFEQFNQPVGSGDFELFSHMTNSLRDGAAQFQQAAWLIRDGIGLAQSIDDFLDQHRTNLFANLYGKAAIVKAILEAEQKSKLYFNRNLDSKASLDVEKLANTWFVKFAHMLARGIPKENVREIFEPVSFIVFNYDRCIEFFLRHALHKLYGIPENEASDIVDDLHIIHPYGVVGSVHDVPFGTTRANYFQLARSIKTYTEQLGAGDVIAQIASEITRAQSLVFLGFAYHNQNMALLKPEKKQTPKLVFGTAFKMSDSDVDVVSHQIADFFSPTMNTTQRSAKIKIDNKHSSVDLFDYYAKSLTGGD